MKWINCADKLPTKKVVIRNILSKKMDINSFIWKDTDRNKYMYFLFFSVLDNGCDTLLAKDFEWLDESENDDTIRLNWIEDNALHFQEEFKNYPYSLREFIDKQISK